MYTPTDLGSNGLIRTDRPYAGWLFGGLVREDRGKIALGNFPAFDHLEFDLGVVGPASLASGAQIWFHDLVDSADPHGWRFQLKNEPGFLVVADRKLLLRDLGVDKPVEVQIIPHAGVMLGNIQTSLKLGAEGRIGHNIPSEFAKVIPHTWGYYMYGAVDGRAVGYNEFLDGEVFRGSSSIAKEPLVLELRWGLVLQIRRVQLRYTYVYMTKEFREQRQNDAYGSLNFTYRF